MGIPYSVVAANELLDEDILEIIPDVCDICGAETEFTESLKQVYCPNSKCYARIAARLESMAKAMQVDDWGEATCMEVCRAFGLISPYQVFLLEGKECSSVSVFQKKVANFCNSPKREAELWQVVKYGGLPDIETTAYKIFGAYSSFEAAYADIEKYQAPFIADKLGLRNSSTGVMAVRVYNTLMQYKNELLFAEQQFRVKNVDGEKIHIAITGGVDGFKNKSEYIDYINHRYYGKLNAIFMNSVTSSVDILVADHDTGSRKYKAAQRLAAKGQDIVITDSRTLLKILDDKLLTE